MSEAVKTSTATIVKPKTPPKPAVKSAPKTTTTVKPKTPTVTKPVVTKPTPTKSATPVKNPTTSTVKEKPITTVKSTAKAVANPNTPPRELTYREHQIAETFKHYGIDGVKRLETIYRRSNKNRLKEKLASKIRRQQRIKN